MNVPAGAVWYVQPFGGPVMNIGGQAGFAGGQLGQIGNLGGGARGKPPGRGAKQPFQGGQKLTGDSLKKLAAELKKQSVPGLGLTALRLSRTEVNGEGLKALKSLPALASLEVCAPLGDSDVKALKELPGL